VSSNDQINYEISEQDFLDAQKLAIRKHPKRATRLILRILPYWGLLVFLGVAWPIFTGGFEWHSAMVAPLAFGVFALSSPLLLTRAQRAAYRKTTSLHGLRTLSMDEQGLSFEGSNFSSQLKWPFFLDFAEDNKSFVLYQSNHIFHPIPKRQLSPQQISDLRDAFTRHILKHDKA
jgi:YcxB-like protein